jgi:hypothetical protein
MTISSTQQDLSQLRPIPIKRASTSSSSSGSTVSECGICWEPKKKAKPSLLKEVKAWPCKHPSKFHPKCVQKLIKMCQPCPYCRAPALTAVDFPNIVCSLN